MTVCVDSNALLAWLQHEPGGVRVAALLRHEECLVSVVNLGEIFYLLAKRIGIDAAEAFWQDTASGVIPVRIVQVDHGLVREAALLKARFPMAYADAFALATAARHSAPIATSDPELVSAAGVLGVDVIEVRP